MANLTAKENYAFFYFFHYFFFKESLLRNGYDKGIPEHLYMLQNIYRPTDHTDCKFWKGLIFINYFLWKAGLQVFVSVCISKCLNFSNWFVSHFLFAGFRSWVLFILIDDYMKSIHNTEDVNFVGNHVPWRYNFNLCVN